jgi:hypothetical protein
MEAVVELTSVCEVVLFGSLVDCIQTDRVSVRAVGKRGESSAGNVRQALMSEFGERWSKELGIPAGCISRVALVIVDGVVAEDGDRVVSGSEILFFFPPEGGS